MRVDELEMTLIRLARAMLEQTKWGDMIPEQFRGLGWHGGNTDTLIKKTKSLLAKGYDTPQIADITDTP